MTAPSVSVVIAAHDEAATIANVVRGAREALGPQCAEVLVVDDGSSDGTAEAARVAGATVLRLDRNQGKGAALRAGIPTTRGEWVVFLDADGQDDPAEIPLLLARAADGPDVALVNGSRFLGTLRRGAISAPNLVGNLAFTGLFAALYGRRVTDSQAGFRAFRGDVVRGLPLRSTEYEIETEMLAQVIRRGFRVVEVPVTRERRQAGTTDFKRVRNGLRILWTIVRERVR